MEEKLGKKLNEEQTVHMKVGSQILEHLSKGIYDNPTNTIKELINNSFDADASKVTIRAKPEFDTFTLHDDGLGMNYLDFSSKFLIISRSDKRDTGDLSTVFKRPLIGFIGIGFVAVSQICNKMTVISSKEDEDFKFEALIDFSKFKKTEHKKKEFYDLSEVKFTNYKEEKDAHYTVIILNELTQEFKDYLFDKDRKEAGLLEKPSFDGMNFREIVETINLYAEGDHKFDLTKDIGKYWRLILDIANTVPVEYLDNGPINSDEDFEVINNIKKDVKKLKFQVDFDGLLLKKPILLPNESEISKQNSDYNIFSFSEKFTFKDKTELEFSGYLYNQKRMIYPPQYRGLIVRLKSVAIGSAVPDFFEYLYGEKQFLNWTFGEIYVNKGLESAMNINRNTFILTHMHYQKLRTYVHQLLHDEIIPNCRERYEKRKEAERKKNDKEIEISRSSYIQSTLGETFDLVESMETSDYPLEVDSKNKKITVYIKHTIFKNISKKERNFLKNIILVLEIAYKKSKGRSDLMKKNFLDGVEELKKWK